MNIFQLPITNPQSKIQNLKSKILNMNPITVIGGGLAGTEAAWQIAQAGIPVIFYEMRPTRFGGAHHTEHLAELVCSNSFGAMASDRAAGLLHEE